MPDYGLRPMIRTCLSPDARDAGAVVEPAAREAEHPSGPDTLRFRPAGIERGSR